MSTTGYIGNVIQSIELIPFEGEAIKEDELIRTDVVVEEIEAERKTVDA